VVAGLVGTAAACPADVVKSRMMNQSYDATGKGLYYANSMDCLRRTVFEEGPLALYKGFLTCWIRLAPWTLVFWVTNEKLRQKSGLVGF